MRPASGFSTISCSVAPVSRSPCSTAQLTGARPRYFGSSEPCMLKAPRRGGREQRRRQHAAVVEREEEVGRERLQRARAARSCGSSGAIDGEPVLARERSPRCANQTFSPGSSSCVTTSAHVDAVRRAAPTGSARRRRGRRRRPRVGVPSVAASPGSPGSGSAAARAPAGRCARRTRRPGRAPNSTTPIRKNSRMSRSQITAMPALARDDALRRSRPRRRRPTPAPRRCRTARRAAAAPPRSR